MAVLDNEDGIPPVVEEPAPLPPVDESGELFPDDVRSDPVVDEDAPPPTPETGDKV